MFKILKKYRMPYLFISPFFILFFLFQLIPIVWTGYISFTEWNGLKTPKWVGLDNYKLMMQDYMFSDAFQNTVVYWLAGIIGILLFALLIALSLNSDRLKFGRFFKTVSFLPYVCASVAMGLIFGMLFDENAGLINEILIHLGGGRIPWLTSSAYAKIPVILLFNWRITPWFTIIILSGLLNISKEYYEAATVDGASIIQQFFYITLPLLRNILFFCTLTITVDTWKMFNESYILPGPGSSNTSLFQLVYQYAFKTFKLGYASALSMVLIFVLLAISVVQFAVRRRQGEI
ncbi:sugar ABC transporter permease [uncultured Sphaerochaeta sp.]|uniref:carbohydrate ABC transporter permease n=1 Tax=uncultured Sphaerochaeta sp. TaxID=886478 RepID=UPI002A0A81C7|nr:sugar ABC transporter permease [uncultured Sphaerochaeta sp.]